MSPKQDILRPISAGDLYDDLAVFLQVNGQHNIIICEIHGLWKK